MLARALAPFICSLALIAAAACGSNSPQPLRIGSDAGFGGSGGDAGSTDAGTPASDGGQTGADAGSPTDGGAASDGGGTSTDAGSTGGGGSDGGTTGGGGGGGSDGGTTSNDCDGLAPASPGAPRSAQLSED